MSTISMKNLLESGVHFGHRTDKLNPKMKDYVYTVRNGIHIIDLQKASKLIDVAHEALKDIVKRGGRVLFVGTKKQSQKVIESEALRSNSFYITSRWLGGTLTNQPTIRKSVATLKKIEDLENSPEWNSLTKKEISIFLRKKNKLKRNLDGIKEMSFLPDAIFVIDLKKDKLAIDEAKKLNIPVFAMVDTNCDPESVDYPMPSNDDAIRAIALITKMIADTIIEGKELDENKDNSPMHQSYEEVQAEPKEKMEDEKRKFRRAYEKSSYDEKRESNKSNVASEQKPHYVKEQEAELKEVKEESQEIKKATIKKVSNVESFDENKEELSEEKAAKKPRAKKVEESQETSTVNEEKRAPRRTKKAAEKEQE